MVVLDEPLVQGEGPSRAQSFGKVVTLLSLPTILCCAVLWDQVKHVHQGSRPADLDQTILAKIGAAASSGRHVQLFPPPASSPRAGMAQVHAMQDTLKRYGVASSPMQKLALTQLVATRDPSMRAQVREAFSEVDPANQDKMRGISKQVIAGSKSIVARAENAKDASAEWGPFVALEKGVPNPLSGVGADATSDASAETPSGVLAFESPENRAKMPGQVKPLMFWDPLKFSDPIDGVNTAGQLYFYREAELKNGRTAMVAVLGLLLTDNFGFHPFYAGPEPYTSPVLSHFTPEMAKNFWPSLAIACGLAELISLPDKSKLPGDLGFDPLGLKPTDEKDFLEIQNKELNNGRLAMIAYAGIVGKELLFQSFGK